MWHGRSGYGEHESCECEGSEIHDEVCLIDEFRIRV